MIEAPEPQEGAKVLDLMEALQASLKSGSRRKTAKKPTKRKAARTKRAS